MSNTTNNNCSNREAVVVPWISLSNGNNSTANNQNASAASTTAHISSHQNLATAKEGRSCKILSLLSARERVGTRNQLCGGRVGWLYNGSYDGVVVTTDGLAHAGAWNPRRLQNMTLAIGPGTPASCVLPTETHSSSLSASSSSSSSVDDEMFQDLHEERPRANEEDTDHGSDNQLHDDNDSEENENDDMEVLPSDAEEGLEYHFDDSGKLVRDSNDNSNDHQEDRGVSTAREEAEAEIARHLSARITQSPGDQDDDEDEDDQPSAPDGGNTGRRGHWEKRQQSILNALNGVGNEEDDHDDSIEDNGGADDESMESHNTNNENSFALENNIGNSSRGDEDDGSADSRDSAALRARDRYNIRQVEQYIDHLESLARRRERRANNDDLLSSPARDQGVYNDSTQMFEREVARSMKHGGCINTVSWLDCGWRISSVSHEDASPFRRYLNGDEGFISSSASYSANNPQTSPYVTPPRSKSRRGLVTAMYPNEYPTQLVTSGDDHLVKFWDVAASMGSISPLPGGSATVTPFSSPKMPMRACSELVDTWKASSTTIGTHKRYLPGIVHPLVTLPTQHRGNVFHVTPVPHSLGKIATCAADGYLRLLDVEVHSTSAGRNRSNSTASASSNTGDSSAIIISPEYQSEDNGEESLFRFHNSSMCFSHHFLNANVGLVCSERGLLHFDLRLPARSQKRGSLVPELSSTCKSCHPWRVGSAEGGDELESAYVFAGGTKNHVGLYDLRMTGSSSLLGNDNQVVQRYRPRALKHKSSVAVSGIDLSKDKRELLVSYESDQVYTFPIFGGKNPTLADIESNNTKQNKYVAELAAYGGHLNRLTFLKSAKYAGPNDEYICTGSDSGHAWIYEKKSGTLVSLIKADNSTCNGIQPHPTLPYFITYGIDSTAKLFRATTPVDLHVDDSDLGRYNYSKQVKYEKSMIVDKGKKALKGKEVDLDDENLSLFPDEASEDNNDDPDHFLGVFIRSRFSENAPYIGNDMMDLSKVLAKNYFTCAKCVGIEEDEPVRSGLPAMKQRVSLIKMRNQADRLGLEFNHEAPWILKPKEHVKNLIEEDGSTSGNSMVSYGCLADLIPDNPSDWIPFERLMANPPQPSLKYHPPESSVDSSINPIWRSLTPVKIGAETEKEDDVAKLDQEASKQPFRLQANEKLVDSCEKQEYNPIQAWDTLFQTISLLKEAGNEALKASLILLAAKRYDKAINYCAVAYLPFPVGTVDFLAEHQYMLSKNGGYECRWNPMLKTLIMLRLNLAMVNLKPEINDAKGAAAQAKLALNELKPFATERGVVLTGKKLTKKRQDEPHSTYTEAKVLQAKAYFRQGSAQIALSDYDEAVKTFEYCVQSTKEGGLTIDSGVLRKMNEAKRCLKAQKGREKKKFKFMFSTKTDMDSKESLEDL